MQFVLKSQYLKYFSINNAIQKIRHSKREDKRSIFHIIKIVEYLSERQTQSLQALTH